MFASFVDLKSFSKTKKRKSWSCTTRRVLSSIWIRCVYDAFADYQLPELLRTPLQSLCLQIKSLQLGSITEFLSSALQPPEPLSVQNAIEYLKIIEALDEKENLTVLGRNLSMLSVEPKLGKMLLLGAIFNCLDPAMTVVAGLSVRDPFLMPFNKKDLAESAKAQFSARFYSDHLALLKAYEGWKEAEKRNSGYEYCWRNFLSAQTLKSIDSLKKQFYYLLKDSGLVDNNLDNCNMWGMMSISFETFSVLVFSLVYLLLLVKRNLHH